MSHDFRLFHASIFSSSKLPNFSAHVSGNLRLTSDIVLLHGLEEPAPQGVCLRHADVRHRVDDGTRHLHRQPYTRRRSQHGHRGHSTATASRRGQEVRPGSTARQCGQSVWPGSTASQCGQSVWPGNTAGAPSEHVRLTHGSAANQLGTVRPYTAQHGLGSSVVARLGAVFHGSVTPQA